MILPLEYDVAELLSRLSVGQNYPSSDSAYLSAAAGYISLRRWRLLLRVLFAN